MLRKKGRPIGETKWRWYKYLPDLDGWIEYEKGAILYIAGPACMIEFFDNLN